jgi:hypothetical protein
MKLKNQKLKKNKKLEKILNEYELLFDNKLSEDDLSDNILILKKTEYYKIIKQVNQINQTFLNKYQEKELPIIRFDCILNKKNKIKCIEINTGTPGMFVDVGTEEVISKELNLNKNKINLFEKKFLSLFKDNFPIYILIPKYKYDKFELNYLENLLIKNHKKIIFITKENLKTINNAYVLNLINKSEIKKYKKHIKNNNIKLINNFTGQKLENKKILIKLSKNNKNYAKTYKNPKKLLKNKKIVYKKNKSNQGKEVKIKKIKNKIKYKKRKGYIYQEYIKPIKLKNKNINLTFFTVNKEVTNILFLISKKDIITLNNSKLLIYNIKKKKNV